MRSPFQACLQITFAVSCLASGAQAQSVFLGTVIADEDPSPPLAGAEVTIPALSFEVRTDSLGRFLFNGIPKGLFRIVIRHVGYNNIALNARFSGADTLAADFAMIPVAVSLDTVSVVGGATRHGKFLEFEDRRTHGGGAFLTRSDLDKERDRQLGEIVAKLPGLRVNRYGAEIGRASCRERV